MLFNLKYFYNYLQWSSIKYCDCKASTQYFVSPQNPMLNWSAMKMNKNKKHVKSFPLLTFRWDFHPNYLFVTKSSHELSYSMCLPVLLPLPIRSIQNRLRSINTCEQMSKSDQCQFQQQSQQESIWWSCTVGVSHLPSRFTCHLINDLQPYKVVTLCVELEMNSQQSTVW